MRLSVGIRIGLWMVVATAGVFAAQDPPALAPDKWPVIPNHPFLFLSAEDITRARRGIESNPEFARMARELARQAAEQDVADLPALDPAWWHSLTNKPWRDCYPENYEHTLARPVRWAVLARDCARASLVNDAPVLAGKGRRLLLRLAGYSFEWQHYDTGMFYTIWAMAALETYDILFDTFTAAERARLDRWFERFLEAVVRDDDYWVKNEPGGKLNNHYAWHKLGRCAIGLFYGRPELVQEALYGPKGIDHLMREGFQDDGLWVEGSIPYQLTTLSPLALVAEMLERSRYTEGLWEDPPSQGLRPEPMNRGTSSTLSPAWSGGEGGRRPGEGGWKEKRVAGPGLRRTYDAMIGLLLPDRTLPSIGDAYARRPHFGSSPDLEILARRFDDPAYSWLIRDQKTRAVQALFTGLPELPAGAPPPQISRVWPRMGYAALRPVEGDRYWSGGGWTAFATFSAKPVHQHADKLSVMLFGGGRLWLPDREAATSAAHAFSSAIQSRLNRETICHNTLLVDDRSQRHPPERLELVEFDSRPNLKRLTIADRKGHLYPGVRQMRTLIVRETEVLDFFQVQSDQPHDYAWMVHVDGRPGTSSLAGWTPAVLPAQAPWSYLRDARRAPSAGEYRESFSHESQTMRFDLRADGPVEMVQCGFPRDDSPDPELLPMRLARCRRSAAWFLASYRLDAPDAADAVDIRSFGARTWEIVVRRGGVDTTHRIPSLAFEVEDWRTPMR
ncbi:MAG: heparinase II/III family protein [Verrucomicrobia bacterium]|nr:heparinase II/III family protein [Verrucomicrobiota bacterium]